MIWSAIMLVTSVHANQMHISTHITIPVTTIVQLTSKIARRGHLSNETLVVYKDLNRM